MNPDISVDHEIVEGTDAHLHVQIHRPARNWTGEPVRPVLLLHGFGSSAKLNWADAGWLKALADAGRTSIAVDLPGHGQSAMPSDLDSYRPSRIRADILQVLNDAGVRPLREADPTSGVDIIGYSFGARLAWEIAGTQPELVGRLVLGGPPATDRFQYFDLTAARMFVADGTPIEDELTAWIMTVAGMGSNNMDAMLQFVTAAKTEGYAPKSTAPHQPLLLVAGEKDDVARDIHLLVDMAEHAGGSVRVEWLPGRNHINAVTSRAFKTAAVEFLAG